MKSRLSKSRLELLSAALTNPRTVKRYQSLISTGTTAAGCRVWTGAISGKGQGRFWVGTLPDGRDLVMIAHRFGYAHLHGIKHLDDANVLRHICDEPSCQNPDHWIPGTIHENTLEWSERRHTIGSPLRDKRGARGRAIALREAALQGEDLDVAAAAGSPLGDQLQDPLFG